MRINENYWIGAYVVIVVVALALFGTYLAPLSGQTTTTSKTTTSTTQNTSTASLGSMAGYWGLPPSGPLIPAQGILVTNSSDSIVYAILLTGTQSQIGSVSGMRTCYDQSGSPTSIQDYSTFYLGTSKTGQPYVEFEPTTQTVGSKCLYSLRVGLISGATFLWNGTVFVQG